AGRGGRGRPGGRPGQPWRGPVAGRSRQLRAWSPARRGGDRGRPRRTRRGAPAAGRHPGRIRAPGTGAAGARRWPLRPPGQADVPRHPGPGERGRGRARGAAGAGVLRAAGHRPAPARRLAVRRLGRLRCRGPAAARQRGAVPQRRRSRPGARRGRPGVERGPASGADAGRRLLRPGRCAGGDRRGRRPRRPGRDGGAAPATLAAAGRRPGHRFERIAAAMTTPTPSDIRAVLIQTEAARLLLPNATISEVLSYADPEPVESAPGWLLGTIRWRGWRLPLVAFAPLI